MGEVAMMKEIADNGPAGIDLKWEELAGSYAHPARTRMHTSARTLHALTHVGTRTHAIGSHARARYPRARMRMCTRMHTHAHTHARAQVPVQRGCVQRHPDGPQLHRFPR
jgi:hypothetical protein